MSGFCIPFGCSGGAIYQQVFSSSLFREVLEIRGLDFFNEVNNGAGDRFVDPAHYVITLSTTSVPIDGLSLDDFDSNRGGDATVVFSGFLGGFENDEVPWGPGSTFPFDWSTPFHYDPRAGNLLLEVGKTGGIFIGDDGVYLDSDESGAPTSYVHDFPRPLGRNNAGLVTRFRETPRDLDPVPEPGTLMLLGSGLAVFIGGARRRGH